MIVKVLQLVGWSAGSQEVRRKVRVGQHARREHDLLRRRRRWWMLKGRRWLRCRNNGLNGLTLDRRRIQTGAWPVAGALEYFLQELFGAGGYLEDVLGALATR